jgi:hyperosmotically inducible periplasmic protein
LAHRAIGKEIVMRNGFWAAGAAALLLCATASAQLDVVTDVAADAAAGAQLQTTLSQDLHFSGVDSDIRDGVATLRGTVRSHAEKLQAEQTARRIAGVTRVRNQLSVIADGAAAAHASGGDAASIDAAVAARLNADTRLASRGITVRTRKDVVTLTGDVATVAEKELAGRLAAEAAANANVDVRNRLVVRTD